LRKTTERMEAVQAGTARLVGTEQAGIVQQAVHLLTDQGEYAQMANIANPFGDGKASYRIANILAEYGT